MVEIIIWNKLNPTPASSVNITNAYEFVLVFGDTPLKANSTYTSNVITTSVYSSNPYKKVHRAVMSTDFGHEFFNRYIPEGSYILDPYFGVGTTGELCIKHKCNYQGIELSDEYIKIAKERLLLL